MPMPVKEQRPRFTLPAWLEPQTVAILGTLLTVGIGVGALVQTSFSGLRDEFAGLRGEFTHLRGEFTGLRGEFTGLRGEFTGLRHEMKEMRQELNAKIGKLDDRLRAVEIDAAAIRVGVLGLDARVRVVEEHAKHPIEAVPAGKTES